MTIQNEAVRRYREKNLEKCRRWCRERGRRDIADLNKYKLEHGCCRCGYNKCPAALCFHHINPDEKECRVHSVRSKEIQKCLLVCANCHYEIHEAEPTGNEAWKKLRRSI